MGRTIVMVMHDLNHAARYAHHVIALCRGQIAAAGTPHEVITPRTVRTVFGVEADIVPGPRFGTPLCIPHTLAFDAES